MNLRKKIREIIESVYMDEEVSVFHGSPHKFDKFSLEKIGTGEGAQAFGWGLYFTDLKDIAEEYSKKLSYVKALDKIRKEIGTEDTTFRVKEVMWQYVRSPQSKGENLLEDLESGYYNKYSEEERNQLRKFAEYKIKNNNVIPIDKNLYKVTLHKGKSPNQYTWLEWDKPIPKDQLKKIDDQFKKEGYNGRVKIKGDKIYKYWGDIEEIKSGKDFYSALAGDKNFTPKEASLFLLRAGIDGIKYPAESLAKGTTSETASGFNYVVFDEKAVEIEKTEGV